jgi:pterin-4a-carbinolamine dehydratase
MTPLAQETCEPCDSKAPPLPESEIPRYLEEVPDWRLERGGDGVPRIRRSFSFDNFHDAARFAEKLRPRQSPSRHHAGVRQGGHRLVVPQHQGPAQERFHHGGQDGRPLQRPNPLLEKVDC